MKQLEKASEKRRAIRDQRAADHREQDRAQAEALGKIGQALARQTEALGELLRAQREARKAPAPQE